MSTITLPTPADFVKTLTALIRKPVTAKTTPAMPPGTKVFVGTYEDGAGALSCLWVCDVPLAASLGAVLTLIPAGVAERAVKAQLLTPEILENAHEVANVCASSFSKDRIRLTAFLAPGEPLPAPVAALLAKPIKRLDLTLVVPSYPGGRLTLIGT